MSIKNRPFSVEPITGIMMPDGVFDIAIVKQRITCFYTNISTGDLNNVSIYFEGISDPSIAVIPQTFNFPKIPAGASVRVSWLGEFKNSSPGKKNISIIAKTQGASLKREIKQIFVTRTTYDNTSKTYTCEYPEGAMKVKFIEVFKSKTKDNCDYKKDRSGIFVPVQMEISVFPNPSYPGQFGDLPFQDPWWKILAIIVAIIAAIVGIIAAAAGAGTFSTSIAGTHDLPSSGSVDCCTPPDLSDSDAEWTVAGVAGVICTGAIAAAFSDLIDPWRRGQIATVPAVGELTIQENLKSLITYYEPPKAGKAYPIEVEWIYTRVTNANTYTHHIRETQINTHVLQNLIVNAPNKIKVFEDPFVFTAQFIRENKKPFVGNELFAYALVVSPTNLAFRVPLLDDGIAFDKNANDGYFTGHLDWRDVQRRLKKEHKTEESSLWGYWRIYIYAQDVNDATSSMTPEEAATHIGGMVVASATEITFDSTLPCPLTANAVVEVVP